MSAHSQVALPPDYPHQCHLTHLETFIALSGGKQTFILEAKYELETKKDTYGRPLVPESEDFVLDPPKNLAWVVPAPDNSRRSEIETDSLMKDLFNLTHPSTKEKYKLRTGRPRGITRFGGSIFGDSVGGEMDGIEWNEFQPTVSIVDDVIQYLKEKGLVMPEGSLLEDYAQRGWGFWVGVQEDPPIAGLLGPLAIEFESEGATFPLRFQSQAGEFTLSVYLLSDTILDHRSISQWDLRGINAWENLHREAWFRGYTAASDMVLPETLSSNFAELTQNQPLDQISFYAWEGKDYNGYGRTTEKFKQDLQILAK